MATNEERERRRRRMKNQTPGVAPGQIAAAGLDPTGKDTGNRMRRLPRTPNPSEAGSQPLDTTIPSRTAAINSVRGERPPRRPVTPDSTDRLASAGLAAGMPQANERAPEPSQLTMPLAPSPATFKQRDPTVDYDRQSNQRLADRRQQLQDGVDDPRARLGLTPEMQTIAGNIARTQGRINQENARIDQIGGALAEDQAIEQGETQTIDPSQPGAGERGQSLQTRGANVRYAPAAPTTEAANLARGRGGLVSAPIGRRTAALDRNSVEGQRSQSFDAAVQRELGGRRLEDLTPDERGAVMRAARATPEFQAAQASVGEDRAARRDAALASRAEELTAERQARAEARRNRLLGITPEMAHERRMLESSRPESEPLVLRPGERAFQDGEQVAEGAEPVRPTPSSDVVNIGGRPWSRTQNRFMDADPPVPMRDIQALIDNARQVIGLPEGMEPNEDSTPRGDAADRVTQLVESRYGNLPVEQQIQIFDQIMLSMGFMPDG